MKGDWVPIVAAVLDFSRRGDPPEEISARMALPLRDVCYVLERRREIRDLAFREFGLELP